MVSLTITFYREGIFVGPPLEYLEGNKDTMKDLDFGNFTYGAKNKQQLANFVAVALGNGGHIDVYVEHHGYNIYDWFAKDNDDLEDFDKDECILDDISSFVKEPQFIGEEEVIIPNRCISDPFLNRLCKTDPKKTTRNTFGTNEGNANALVEDEKEDQSVDPIYKAKPRIVYPGHDPNQPWKDMVPILRMKFTDHEEIKMMLANYGVANSYQLWYKRNDYKPLLVLCGRNVKEGRCASKVGRKGIKENVSKASKGKEKVAKGKGKEKVAEGKGKEKVKEDSKVVVGNKKWSKQTIKLSKSPSKKGTKRKTSDNFCKFRLWGSWMQNEASFHIKTLIPDHNCDKVFDFGALVMYKWIARHYVREIVSNPKISHRELQAAIRDKFLINVSLGQLLKTNPISTVKLDVDEVSGGKTYFKRFYVCFKAMKDGWTEGCRKVIGLDGCFLKGTIKGELLTAMRRDANNQMFLIAWAVVTVENKDNWLWFLVSLGDDLNLNRGATGLKEAMDRSCGAFENGICESYHAATINQRGKPIITMLEDIRIYLMQRLWEVYPSGYREFEVRKLNAGFGVNLETHKCTCRLWDMTGIPCIHGVPAYAFLMKDHAEGVSNFYSKRAWQNYYSSFIKLVGGQLMWVKTGLPPLMPPKKRVMPGRPKGKRQKHPSEGGQSGFESAASALKRMRVDATASGSGLNEEEDADPANADHASADHANADLANADPREMEHGEMEQPVHMEEPVNMEEPVHMEEPV
ncbi:calcium/proton exchanger [Tanacetum coccineum]|uniref:Calcium/proton exchanger n=1 Tax=Tanacetum coccineum TaxID=301880 RepID=A0ABQ4YFX0_9ASTR